MGSHKDSKTISALCSYNSSSDPGMLAVKNIPVKVKIIIELILKMAFRSLKWGTVI
jgi:hypothetical protein